MPKITEEDGIRTIGATKSIDEDAFIDGLWGIEEGLNNKIAENVENSQLETFDSNGEKWYNTNDMITDGSHLSNGKQKSNVKYKSGEYDYIYKTDEFGRISNLHTDQLQYTERDNRLKHDPNTLGKEKGDHAGHLIGDRFGGSPDIDNLVSQSALVNLSEYKSVENIWAKAIDNGQKVSVDIKVQYDGNAMRPTGFEVQFAIDGRTFSKTIKN